MIADNESSAIPSSIVNHLDKSHLCIHTYPEEHFNNNVAIFRADIEISTCGVITPLKILDRILEKFSPDLINIDYRVRGFNLINENKKQFLDHEIYSIQQFISQDRLNNYQTKDINLPKANLFHTSLLIKELDFNTAFVNSVDELTLPELTKANDHLMLELTSIFSSLTS